MGSGLKFDNWAEALAFIVLVLGFFLATTTGSAFVSYVIIFLIGLMAGRIWYRIKKNFKIAWSLILGGFLIGFVLGSFYGSRKFIILLYIIGVVISYHLHAKGYIKSVEY